MSYKKYRRGFSTNDYDPVGQATLIKLVPKEELRDSKLPFLHFLRLESRPLSCLMNYLEKFKTVESLNGH